MFIFEAGSMSTVNIELYPKAESYRQDILAKIDINIGPVGYAYRGLLRELDEVVRGSKIYSAAYLEGLYGSGKTLVLRKLVYDIISGPDKEKYKNVIPIYFFLGEIDFRLLQELKKYFEDLITYINTEVHPVRPNIIGEKSDWKSRLPILEETVKFITEVEKSYKLDEEREVLGFFHVLREINKRGYYPLLIFDEFERVIYTGDGLKSGLSRKAFVTYTTRYLELTRGHLYSGMFVITTTRPIDELVKTAVEEERPHMHFILSELAISPSKVVEDFPLVRGHIVYDFKARLDWLEPHLELLANRYGLILHRELLHLVAHVLPIPRAIVQIDKKIKIHLGAKPDVVTPQDLYNVLEPMIVKFVERLKKEKIDNRSIITARTQWHLKFIELLKKGFFVVKSSVYNDVAKVLGISIEDSRKARQKVSQLLRDLSKLELFEATGEGEYRLNPHILAYALEIDRLPDGSIASLDEVIGKIKNAIKRKREVQKKYREREEQETRTE
jgi:hypothetical protein